MELFTCEIVPCVWWVEPGGLELHTESCILSLRLSLVNSSSSLRKIRMSYLGVGVSPGNVPVYHGTNSKVIDRRVRLAELVLRCVICCLGVLAAVLVGTDTQVKEIFSIQKKARFTDMKALV